MYITKYKVQLTKDNLNALVKEVTNEYSAGDEFGKPLRVVAMLNELYQLSSMAEEHLYEIAFNKKMRVVGIFEVSHGTVDMAFRIHRAVCSLTKNGRILVQLDQVLRPECLDLILDLTLESNVKNGAN